MECLTQIINSDNDDMVIIYMKDILYDTLGYIVYKGQKYYCTHTEDVVSPSKIIRNVYVKRKQLP